jgi:hypothetical protein
MISHVPVSSSVISSVGHDEESKTLEVKFKNGKVYTYAGVTLDEFESFVGAESVGKHFNTHIAGREKK